ncbi:MAG: ceramidase domain-containing protein [Bacteroidetes bacterium]|nr:ceramidase domain-containing protein [Bacteroidota bacterium]
MNKFRIHFKWQILRTRLYLERLEPKNFIFPLSLFLLTTSALLFYYNLFQFTDAWENWKPAIGNTFHFCERDHMDQIIRQPSNTWSNLGFLVVGLFTLTLGIQDLKYSERKQSDNFLVRYPVFSILFGLSAIYLFIGSFMYHASLTMFFQKLDQTSMCAVVVMMITFNLYKIFPLIRLGGTYRSSHALMVAVAVGINYFIYSTLYIININLLFPLLLVIVFITSCYYLFFVSKEHYFTNYMWAAFAILVVSSTIWILDRTNVACSPESIFQGHALWHLFNSFSILFIYLYYRSGTVPLERLIEAKKERRALRRGEL